MSTCKENFLEEKAAHRKSLHSNVMTKPDNPQEIYRASSIKYVPCTYRPTGNNAVVCIFLLFFKFSNYFENLVRRGSFLCTEYKFTVKTIHNAYACMVSMAFCKTFIN